MERREILAALGCAATDETGATGFSATDIVVIVAAAVGLHRRRSHVPHSKRDGSADTLR